MEDKKQKNIIYVAVGIIVVIIVGFYIYNRDFIMNGGFGGQNKVDESWESFKKSFSDSLGKIKNQIEEAKNPPAPAGEKDARLLEILKEKIEMSTSGATSSKK